MTFIDDIKQQNENVDCMNSIVNRFCRDCLIIKQQRSNLNLDFVKLSIFHYRVVIERKFVDVEFTNFKRDKFYNKLNMRFELNSLHLIFSILNIFRFKFDNVTYFEYVNLVKQTQTLLFFVILTKIAQSVYIVEFRKIFFFSI